MDVVVFVVDVVVVLVVVLVLVVVIICMCCCSVLPVYLLLHMNDLRRAEHAAKMEEQGGTCYGEAQVYEKSGKFEHEKKGYQNKGCVCPTNNTCTWAHDGVCDDVEMTDTGVCAQGTDCEDCGTCNWNRCVSKADVPKPTTRYNTSCR